MSLWDRIRCSKEVLGASTPLEKRRAALKLLSDASFVGDRKFEADPIRRGLQADIFWLAGKEKFEVRGGISAQLTYQASRRTHSQANEFDEAFFVAIDDWGDVALTFRGTEAYSNSIDVTVKLSRIAIKNLIVAIEQSGALEREQLPAWGRKP